MFLHVTACWGGVSGVSPLCTLRHPSLFGWRQRLAALCCPSATVNTPLISSPRRPERGIWSGGRTNTGVRACVRRWLHHIHANDMSPQRNLSCCSSVTRWRVLFFLASIVLGDAAKGSSLSEGQRRLFFVFFVSLVRAFQLNMNAFLRARESCCRGRWGSNTLTAGDFPVCIP